MPAIADTFRLTSGDLQAVVDQAVADAARIDAAKAADVARAKVLADLRAWQQRSRPDHLDVLWARWQDWSRMVSETPFPTHHARNWSRGVKTAQRGAPFMPSRSPDNHRTERFTW